MQTFKEFPFIVQEGLFIQTFVMDKWTDRKVQKQ